MSESDIYDLLHQHGIPHMAEKVAGGDVGSTSTEMGKTGKGEHCLRWHRIVLGTVAWDLAACGSGKVLVSCIADAAESSSTAQSLGIMY